MLQPDEIIRSNRKTLSISIDAFNRLIVRAPKRCDEERIFAFIQKQETWILRKRAKMAGAGMQLPPENLDGYEFLLLGKPCKICLDDGANIRFDTQNGKLYLPKENARVRIVKWLKENALRIFLQVTNEWSARMGVQAKTVAVSSAKSRWGSCSADNSIRYTFRLLYAPKEIIEYVAVHELAHIRHKNHSPRFWQEVAKYIPDWKHRRDWLKYRGALLQIF